MQRHKVPGGDPKSHLVQHERGTDPAWLLALCLVDFAHPPGRLRRCRSLVPATDGFGLQCTRLACHLGCN